MTRTIIFGGHGKIALLAEALLTGPEAGRIPAPGGDAFVTGVIRNPEHSDDVRNAGAAPVAADLELLDTDRIAELISGHDAIVWSAGAGGGDPERTRAVDRDAAIRTMDAAQLAGVKRYVMVSYFGASPEHGIDASDPFFAYAEAKAAADAYLRSTALDWTILGPGALTLEEPSGRIDAGGTASGPVSRGNVARVIVATLSDPTTIGRTIEFTDGGTPIPQAVRG